MPDYAFNRQASYDYEFLEKYEAGLVLSGQEVKSIRAGRLSLQGAYVVINQQEPFLINANLPPYQPNNTPANYDPTRSRKILLNKKEILALLGRVSQSGLTLVPIRVYNKSGKIKLEFALARGKKRYDKREQIGRRDANRKIQRAVRGKIE